MARAKLTKRSVAGLPSPSKGDYLVWDTKLSGFGVRITAKGRKVFVVGYRPRGSRQFRRVTLGPFGTLTVDAARIVAKRTLAHVAGGGDPMEERTARRTAPTVAELGLEYLQDVAAHKKDRTSREYVRLWEKHVKPALGAKPVREVTSASIALLHRQMRSTPFLANRVLALLGAFFSYAERQRIRERHTNPAHEIEFYAEHSRERFLTPAEVSRLGQALSRAELTGLPSAPNRRRRPSVGPNAKHRSKSAGAPTPANPFAIAAIRFLLLSGWREREALTLRWSDVDLHRRKATLSDTKTGRSIRPLGAPACALLAALPKLKGSPYVFPGRSEGKPLVELGRVWYAVRDAAGLNEVRLHDLRHTNAATLASGGASLLIVGRILGHRDSATTAKYAHLLDDPVQAAADKASQELSLLLCVHESDSAA
jgi:integrase